MSEKTLSEEIIRLGEIAAGRSWETEFRAIAAEVRTLTAERDELVEATKNLSLYVRKLRKYVPKDERAVLDDALRRWLPPRLLSPLRTLTAERDELVRALERALERVNVEGIQLSRVPDDGDPEVVVSIVKRSGERLQEVSREALAKLKEKP